MYIRNHALSHGMRLADVLVAATAIESGATLLTANVRHYRALREISLQQYRPLRPFGAVSHSLLVDQTAAELAMRLESTYSILPRP